MNNIIDLVNEVSKIDDTVLGSFKIKDELYPGLWDGTELKPEIRKRLLVIAKDFLEGLEFEKPIKITDVVLTGSGANYNWSKFSDIDLHIRTRFSNMNQDEELVKKMFDGKRGLWNDAHNIEINGLPVEIYVENTGETHVASGLYSLIKNEWISIPKRNDLVIDIDDVKSKAESYLGTINYLNELMDNKNYIKVILAINTIKDKLKRMRQAGLSGEGEYSVENLAFKVLRRSGYIGEVLELKRDAYDKLRSIGDK